MKRKKFLQIVKLSWVMQNWVLKTILLKKWAPGTQLSQLGMANSRWESLIHIEAQHQVTNPHQVCGIFGLSSIFY